MSRGPAASGIRRLPGLNGNTAPLAFRCTLLPMSTHDAPSSPDEGELLKQLLARIADRFGISGRTDSDRRAWVVPWILAVALHAAAICSLWRFGALAASPIHPPGPEVIHVVLTPEATPSPEPRAFTELPSDRADSPPAKADFLSNVTSRARDRVPGGNTDLPHAQGEADAAMVRLERKESPSQPASATSASRASEPARPRTEAAEPVGMRKLDSPAEAQAESSLADRRPPARVRPAADATIRVNPGSLGSADFPQPQMDSDGNAGLTGDVSLNTIAWDYAPWMERFSRKLMDRWVAPLAYSYGVLKEGGWCVIDVEISKSGEILNLATEESHEHPALTQAAESAVRATAPMEHLPADFPEPTLKLRLRMIYPRIRPR